MIPEEMGRTIRRICYEVDQWSLDSLGAHDEDALRVLEWRPEEEHSVEAWLDFLQSVDRSVKKWNALRESIAADFARAARSLETAVRGEKEAAWLKELKRAADDKAEGEIS